MTKSIKEKISAIVLAGGKSSRMGQDKALLTIGKNTLLARTSLIARDCADRVYVVTPWTGKYQTILPPGCQLVKEQLVLDAQSNTPLIGFTQGLQLVETEWVLLLACDLPRLSSSQVKQWSLALATVLPTEIALLPRQTKGWEPLCGFYRRDCLPLLEAYLAQGGQSFQSWLANYSVRELSVNDRSCLFNCNTPEDWEVIKIQNMKDEEGSN
ncbi:molybdenum cofactor guanylyltransferase [Pleurocapsa sp. PCC 7319]|uniref:molybdenum cofactor guanylyltransferase n=1 Tax=Pleurocapsa sp. PCC 7319 TaxID=118161 RepID=UPI0003455564|nr:molybdenum cofactor guanylyltransferase [Pleurocapsa sp. PCC 7319]